MRTLNFYFLQLNYSYVMLQFIPIKRTHSSLSPSFGLTWISITMTIKLSGMRKMFMTVARAERSRSRGCSLSIDNTGNTNSTTCVNTALFIITVTISIRGRSQLSTIMKAYREYARGRGSGTTVRFFPENQHLFVITDNVF